MASVRFVRFVPISENTSKVTLSLSPISTFTTRDNGTERTIRPCFDLFVWWQTRGGGDLSVDCPQRVDNHYLPQRARSSRLRAHGFRRRGGILPRDSRLVEGQKADRREEPTTASSSSAGRSPVFQSAPCHRRFRKREDRAAALRLLEEMGYIRRVAAQNVGGRPSEKHEVNQKWSR